MKNEQKLFQNVTENMENFNSNKIIDTVGEYRDITGIHSQQDINDKIDNNMIVTKENINNRSVSDFNDNSLIENLNYPNEELETVKKQLSSLDVNSY